MNEPRSFRVFLSAVSKELAFYRTEVARVLRRKGLEVRDQEHFRQGPATLLQQLRDYISQCDAVVLLVGERCGAFPTDEHAAALGAVPLFQKYAAAAGQANASYTQWEFFLAKHHGRKTYVFLTAPGFTPPEPNPEDAALRACQTAYRQWIQHTGEHYDALTTPAKLIEDLLVLPFPDLGRPKPIALPYPSLGALFKGRDGFLNRLRDSLERAVDGRAAAVVGKAVHGLGGVGKTRLAVEYAWRHQDDYTALLFVPADSPEALRRNLAGLCGPLVLDLPEQHVAEEEARLAAALHWLQRNPGWFLILDNLDTPKAAAEAERLLARLHGGQVLFTSRLALWSGQVEPLELDVLALDDAADFLSSRTDARRRKTPDDAAQVRTLAEELGQLALALEQAGAYIARRRLSIAGYLQEWYSRRDQVLTWFDERLMQYPCSVAVTWQTSFDQLGEPARRLLRRLAWLAPEPIPESLLDVPLAGTEVKDADPRDALGDLETYSLATRAPNAAAFSVHRLVQDVTRRNLSDEDKRHNLEDALRWVDAAFAGDPQDIRSWPTLDPLAPHARAVVRHADAAGMAEPTARLMNQIAVLLNTKALHAEAEPLMRRALAIDEKAFGTEHPDVASRLNNLAQLLQDTNRLGEAEPLMRRALAIDDKAFGADHPKVAIRLNNLASLLQATNRLAEAESLMRRALAIDDKAFGADHPKVAIRLNNLAQLLQDTNRLPEAEPLMRRALAIDEKAFGADHPNVARDLNNLAQLLKATNRLPEAERLMRRHVVILIDFTRRTGHKHPHLQASLANYAALLEAMGKTDAEVRAVIESLSAAE